MAFSFRNEVSILETDFRTVFSEGETRTMEHICQDESGGLRYTRNCRADNKNVTMEAGNTNIIQYWKPCLDG